MFPGESSEAIRRERGRNGLRGKEAPRTAGTRSVEAGSDAPPAAPSFPSCRKRRGRKGALGRVLVHPASVFRREPIFYASFHSIVTLRVFDYAPPDTGVSNLQLVSVEYLPSIEGATELLMGATFLRGPCSGAIIRQRSTANSGWRSLCGDQSSISSNASSPFLASALTSPWRTKSMVTKLRATNSAA